MIDFELVERFLASLSHFQHKKTVKKQAVFVAGSDGRVKFGPRRGDFAGSPGGELASSRRWRDVAG